MSDTGIKQNTGILLKTNPVSKERQVNVTNDNSDMTFPNYPRNEKLKTLEFGLVRF